MFFSDDADAISSLLDNFQVPMFVADRESGEGDAPSYRLIAINDAHSRASSLPKDVAAGALVTDLLTPEDAGRVNARYDLCHTTNQRQEYDETLSLNGTVHTWHTLLLPIVTDGGRKRIVGNAIVSDGDAQAERARRDADDVEYFVMQSQFQLSRLSAYLDALSQRRGAGLPTTDFEILSALCRTVDRTLSDIRGLSAHGAIRSMGREVATHVSQGAVPDSEQEATVRASLDRLAGALFPLH